MGEAPVIHDLEYMAVIIPMADLVRNIRSRVARGVALFASLDEIEPVRAMIKSVAEQYGLPVFSSFDEAFKYIDGGRE
jgi:citrate lyase beta subunit